MLFIVSFCTIVYVGQRSFSDYRNDLVSLFYQLSILSSFDDRKFVEANPEFLKKELVADTTAAKTKAHKEAAAAEQPQEQEQEAAEQAQPAAAQAPEQPQTEATPDVSKTEARTAPDAAKVEAIANALEAATGENAGACAVLRMVAKDYLDDMPAFVAGAVAAGFHRVTAGVQFGAREAGGVSAPTPAARSPDMVWCVILLTGALESNAPKACFESRETCRAYIAHLGLAPAQCERRNRRPN